jgi:hypothetical protein
MYLIQPYSYQQAERLGVLIKPSTNPLKKLDVFQKGKKVASIGAMGFGDFPTFLKKDGKAFAEERRRLYHLRHRADEKDTPSYFAKRLLW